MKLLKKKGPLNVSEIARGVASKRPNVKEALNTASRRGHVKDTFMRQRLAWGGHVLVHVYQVTKAGEKWLKER